MLCKIPVILLSHPQAEGPAVLISPSPYTSTQGKQDVTVGRSRFALKQNPSRMTHAQAQPWRKQKENQLLAVNLCLLLHCVGPALWLTSMGCRKPPQPCWNWDLQSLLIVKVTLLCSWNKFLSHHCSGQIYVLVIPCSISLH